MVYGTYNYSIPGAYKPTNITWGASHNCNKKWLNQLHNVMGPHNFNGNFDTETARSHSRAQNSQTCVKDIANAAHRITRWLPPKRYKLAYKPH